MTGEAGATTAELLTAWRAADAVIDDSEPGTPEHAEAVRRAGRARAAYQARLDVLKDDLRDG
jgi:hypothetical protein